MAWLSSETEGSEWKPKLPEQLTLPRDTPAFYKSLCPVSDQLYDQRVGEQLYKGKQL